MVTVVHVAEEAGVGANCQYALYSTVVSTHPGAAVTHFTDLTVPATRAAASVRR